MVDRSYMTEKPPGPAEWKRQFNQIVMPGLIDLAGGLEQVVERLATRARTRPILAVGLGFGMGCLLGLVMLSGRRASLARPGLGQYARRLSRNRAWS